MRIKLIAAAAILLMGSVDLGLGQVTSPTLEVVKETQTSVTLLLTAGSDAIDGFDIYYWIPGHGFFLTNFYGTAEDSSCERYTLEPGESLAVTIGAPARQRCRHDFTPRPLYCGRTYYFMAFPHNGSIQSNVTDGRTLECGF